MKRNLYKLEMGFEAGGGMCIINCATIGEALQHLKSFDWTSFKISRQR